MSRPLLCVLGQHVEVLGAEPVRTPGGNVVMIERPTCLRCGWQFRGGPIHGGHSNARWHAPRSQSAA